MLKNIFKDDSEYDKINYFQENGYVIFKNLFPLDVIDNFWNEFEIVRDNDPLLLFWDGIEIIKGYQIEKSRKQFLRTVNLLSRMPEARKLSVKSEIMNFINTFYNQKLSCIQSLAFSKSSKQSAHSDKFLVSPEYIGDYNRNTLCAAWIACENSDESNGALEIYPGSHLIEGKPQLANFGDEYQSYSNALIDYVQKNGCEKDVFKADKGDVLLWHGDFVHAGGLPQNKDKTRFSYVCHYAQAKPRNVLENGGSIFKVEDNYIFQSSSS